MDSLSSLSLDVTKINNFCADIAPLLAGFIDSGWFYASTLCALLNIFEQYLPRGILSHLNKIKWGWRINNNILLQHTQAQWSYCIQPCNPIGSDCFDTRPHSHLDGQVIKLTHNNLMYQPFKLQSIEMINSTTILQLHNLGLLKVPVRSTSAISVSLSKLLMMTI